MRNLSVVLFAVILLVACRNKDPQNSKILPASGPVQLHPDKRSGGHS